MVGVSGVVRKPELCMTLIPNQNDRWDEVP